MRTVQNLELTAEHGIFNCFLSKYFIHALAIILDKKYNDGKTKLIS